MLGGARYPGRSARVLKCHVSSDGVHVSTGIPALIKSNRTSSQDNGLGSLPKSTFRASNDVPSNQVHRSW